MRRGCRVMFVHFHSYPILSRASQEKARELARCSRVPVPTRGCCSCRSARSSSASCSPSPPPLRVVIYRRLMMRIAEAHRAAQSRPGAGHRRRRRPGRLADAREHGRDRQRRRACRCCGRSSAWTRKRSPRKRSGSAPIQISIIPDQDCCTLFTPRTRRRRRAARSRARRRRAADRRDRRAGRRRGGHGALRVSARKVTYPRRSAAVRPDARRERGDRVKITPGKLAGMKAVSDDAA